MTEIKILSETKLICGGFIYVRSKLPVKGKTYWEYQKLRKKECKARVITAFNIFENKNYFVRESTLDDHAHVPNQEECEAEIIKYSLRTNHNYHLLKYYVQRWLAYLTGFSVNYLTVII